MTLNLLQFLLFFLFPLHYNRSVPWTDIKYILAGIMYGGHITDYWDRRCNTTYLDVLLQETIFKGCMLAPGFRAPDANKMDYVAMDTYILEKVTIF